MRITLPTHLGNACIVLVVIAAIAGCGGDESSNSRVSAEPAQEIEPNNDSPVANGPVGPEGIVVVAEDLDDEDFVYFKTRQNRPVTITAKHLGGRCAHTWMELVYPGPTRAEDGGDLGDLQAPLRPGVDLNRESTSHIGDLPGTVLSEGWTANAEDSPRGVLVGHVYPNGDGLEVRDCKLLIKARPADALITTPSPQDRDELSDQDLAGG